MNTPSVPNLPPESQPSQPAASLIQVLEAAPALQSASAPPSDGSVALAPQSSPPAVTAQVLPLQRIHRGRRGKIARLPRDLRDMVNRMLRNNIPYRNIVGALSEYNIHVTERNVSNWKVFGGYKEWCLAEDHAVELHMHQDNLITLLRKENASEVPEVGLQVAATRLAEFFLTPAAAELLANNPDEYQRRVLNLARITAEIQKLQKYRDDNSKELGPCHRPERLRRENEEELEGTRKSYSSTNSPDGKTSIPHRNYLPKDP